MEKQGIPGKSVAPIIMLIDPLFHFIIGSKIDDRSLLFVAPYPNGSILFVCS